MRNDKLKIKDVHAMYRKVFCNAMELVKESELLYENKRFARAYHTAQLALEEFGTLSMLYVQALRLYNKENISWTEMAVAIRRNDIDNDVILGIVLMIEKESIKYAPQHDMYLYQPKINFPEDLEQYKVVIGDEAKIVEVLEVFKTLNTPEILKEPSLRNEILRHINKYRNNSQYADFWGEDLVIPSEVIDEIKCKKRIMSVLLQKKITELTGFQESKFDLFKFGKEHYERLNRQIKILQS